MLRVDHLTVAYGAHRALEDVSIHVGQGEICVILGANGAGKSTLLKAVAGMVDAAPGAAVTIGGKAITGLKPHRIVESGVALVPEGRGIFGDLTVAENLELGAYGAQARAGEAARLKQVLALFPKLGERRGQVARTMSGGEQQMVAIGRALMSNPSILMLDEPSLGLSPLLTRDLFRSLRAVRETGVGILLVEQNAKQSLAIADRGYLLENGHIIGEDSAARLARDPAVQAAYLGGAVSRDPAMARPREQVAHAGPSAARPAAARLPETVSARTMAEALARHASRVQREHVRHLRDGTVNGHAHRAFDAHVVSGEGIVMSDQARELSRRAGELARQAQQRQHAFVLARRDAAAAGRPQGVAPASPPQPPAQARPAPVAAASPQGSGRVDTGPADAAFLARHAGDLAARARQRQADHLAALRSRGHFPPSAGSAPAERTAAAHDAPAAPVQPATDGAAMQDGNVFDADDIERQLRLARLKAEEKALRKMLKKLRKQIDDGM